MTFDERLRAKLRAHLNDLADDISGGSAVDYDHYKFMVGKIEGLALAERELLDLLDDPGE